MKRFYWIILVYLSVLPAMGQEKTSFDLDNNHDIPSLYSWGPYSKRYAGISHIPNIKRGMRFDFSVMPGYYRNRQLVPHVLFESSYYPWKINPEMNRITYRYELEWKDKVYVDVTYHILDDSRTLVEIHCVNNTAINQNLVLNNIAYIDYPEHEPLVEALGTEHLKWYNAIDYSVNEPAIKTPQYALVYDGWNRNEERTTLSLDGSVLDKGFGKDKGDKVAYNINIREGYENGIILFRYKVNKGKNAVFQSNGLIKDQLIFEDTGDFEVLKVPYACDKPEDYILELISEGNSPVQLDGFFIGKAQDIDSLNIKPRNIPFTPSIERGKGQQDFILKYPECKNYYGVAWNFKESEIREILNNELESFFRRKVHDHVARILVGNKQWHYTNAFLRPIVMSPNSGQTLYSLICTGNKEQVSEQLQSFHVSPDKIISEVKNTSVSRNNNYLPEAEKYSFSQQLLQATLLSNIVYPVYTQQQYIRHFTPGMNWNSLYTWDLGFISLGLIDIDRQKAFEAVKAYTTPVDSESAFIHHGTPLPIQMFAYFDLWNNGLSNQSLEYLYPRLKQYFDFMVGTNTYSTTQMKGSGLLRTWDYFYNSGGWDDYPPQQALRDDKPQYPFVTPVVTSAYYLRAAKILRLAAKELDIKTDLKYYDQVIQKLSSALQNYSWDNETGYFSYVVHNENGQPKDKFRYKDGSNFNMGLDGVSPFVSGICTPEQNERLISHLFSPDELWTDLGISTVDKSASYYRADGYWNGAVWFPHQWVMWKALLDNGKGQEAYKVATTALNTWQKECAESYHTFEHFIISSGRGAGWHQFSGLSSPLLNWYAAYYKTGKVSTGFEIWINDDRFNENFSSYEAKISFDDSTVPHKRTMIVIMNPDYKYTVRFKEKPLKAQSCYPGMLEITFPADNKTGRLNISIENLK
ncbi:MGH1-like glycoside hydrolase domain-containing protein [Dysgonomonas reticulitermitis]